MKVVPFSLKLSDKINKSVVFSLNFAYEIKLTHAQNHSNLV